MSDKFLSAPVNSGDCFYVERCIAGGLIKNAIVDGGKGKIDFINKGDGIDDYLIKKGINEINILAVTHNDIDHAGGCKRIIKNNHIAIGEVYLPAIWFDRIQDIEENPEKFFDELLEDISNETLPNSKTLQDDSKYTEVNDKNESLDLDDLSNFLKCNICLSELVKKSFHSGSHYKIKMLSDALKALSNILEIYKTAIKRRLPITWFEFDDKNLSSNLQSVSGILRPVNCKRYSPLIRQHRAYRWLELTMTNVRALVFYSPANLGGDILFTSDSPLGFGIPPSEEIICTVPHHGNDSNASAIIQLTNTYSNAFYVRNSEKRNKGPGLKFLSTVPRGIRYCDVCKSTTVSIQEVEFLGLNGTWNLQKGQTCCC